MEELRQKIKFQNNFGFSTIWLIGIIFVGLFLGILLVVFYSLKIDLFSNSRLLELPQATVFPSSTPFTDQIFVNARHQYQLVIPPNWLVKDSDLSLVSFILDCDLEKGEVCSKFDVLTLDQRKENLESQFIIDIIRLEKPDKIFEKRELVFEGERAIETVYWQGNYPRNDGTYGRLIYILIFNHNNKSYQISYEEIQKDTLIQTPWDWKNMEALKKILSTFKFLD